jgi:hypothetical protein
MAFYIDEALGVRRLIEAANAEKRTAPPPGTRWATDAEQGIDDYAAALADSQAALETNGRVR